MTGSRRFDLIKYLFSRPPSTRILHPTPLSDAKRLFSGYFSTPAPAECALYFADKLSPLGKQVHRDDPRDHQNCRLRDRAIRARYSKSPSPLYSGQTLTILFVSYHLPARALLLGIASSQAR